MLLCPEGHSELKITERQGIEIDYCPECRGVWLDRGELDKMIDRSATQQPYREVEERPSYSRERERYDDDERHDRYPGGKRKRRSFLDDLFDFD